LQKAAHLGEEDDFLVALAQFVETGRKLGVEILLGDRGLAAHHRAADDHEAYAAEQTHIQEGGHRKRDCRDLSVEIGFRAARRQHYFFARLQLANDMADTVHQHLALFLLGQRRRRRNRALAARRNRLVEQIESLVHQRLECHQARASLRILRRQTRQFLQFGGDDGAGVVIGFEIAVVARDDEPALACLCVDQARA